VGRTRTIRGRSPNNKGGNTNSSGNGKSSGNNCTRSVVAGPDCTFSYSALGMSSATSSTEVMMTGLHPYDMFSVTEDLSPTIFYVL